MTWLKSLTTDKDKINRLDQFGTDASESDPGLLDNIVETTILGVPLGLAEVVATTKNTVGDMGNSSISIERQQYINKKYPRMGQAYSAEAQAELKNDPAMLEFDRRYKEAEKLKEEKVNFWNEQAASLRSDPRTTGKAGQLLNEVMAVIPRTIAGTVTGGPIGGALAAGAPVAGSESFRLQKEGVDKETADKAGAVSATVMGIGAVIPGSTGVKSLVVDATLSAGANVALGVAERSANSALLDSHGYKEQAAQYAAFDKTAIAIDATLGLFFTGAERIGRTEVNAAFTEKMNQQERTSGLGLPVDHASAVAHDNASMKAVEQLLAGKQVNIADTLTAAEFIKPAGNPLDTFELPRVVESGATYGARDSVVRMITGLEKGAKPDAKNPLSSATGNGQFIESTWISSLQKHRPDLIPAATAAKLKNKTWQQIKSDKALMAELKPVLDLRKDGDLSFEMTGHLVDDNADELARYGIANPTAMDLYLAHHFGASRVPKMNANPDAMMRNLLTKAERNANPTYEKKTVKQVVAGFEKRAGVKATAPVERTPFASPEQLMQNEFVGNAKKLGVPETVARQIAPKSPMDDVTGFFDGRQSGVKANTIERAQQHVADTGEPAQYVSADVFNLGGLNQAVGNRAEAANVHYRAMADIVAQELKAVGGDVVPLRTGGDEFGAVVINAEPTKIQAAIQKAEARVADYGVKHGLSDIPHSKRSNEKGVGLHFGVADIHPGVSVRDILDRADGGVNASKLGIKYVPRETIGTVRAQSPSGQTGRTESGNAAPDGSVRPEGRAGDQTKSGQKASEITPVQDALQSADRMVAESPDLMVNDGYDADGKPVMRPASEVLAEAQAEHAKELQEAEMADVAIACFQRRGD